MDQQAAHTPAAKPEWALSRRERKRQALLAAGIAPARFPWPWLVGVVAIVGVAAVAIPQLNNSQASTPAATVAPTAQVVKRLLDVDVETAQRRTLTETLKATGSLAPRRSIALSAQVSGTMQAVNVRVGDTVRAGDVLAQVDVETSLIQLSQQRATAAATRAQLAQAKSQLGRTLNLAESGLTPSANVEAEQAKLAALEANLEALEAQVAAAEIVIRNATIIAPFDGIVASRPIEPGQLVSPGAALMSLVDLSVMEMTAYVPVSSSPLLSPGQKVSLTIEGLPGRQFEGTVEGVSPVAAQGTRTVPVTVVVPNEDGLLRGGMFASGRIVTEEAENALAVPETALRNDAAGRYVLTIVDGALVRQPVEVAREWDGGRMAEIASGLDTGSSYVSRRLEDLEPGMPVTVVGN